MRQRLVITDGKSKWVNHEEFIAPKGRKMNAQGEDLTLDGYINKHGGIVSSIDNKAYTTKTSYMNHISQNGCEIKDY